MVCERQRLYFYSKFMKNKFIIDTCLAIFTRSTKTQWCCILPCEASPEILPYKKTIYLKLDLQYCLFAKFICEQASPRFFIWGLMMSNKYYITKSQKNLNFCKNSCPFIPYLFVKR